MPFAGLGACVTNITDDELKMGESVTTPIRKASFRDENFLLPVPKSANSTNVIGDRQLAPLASITTKSQVDQCPEKQ